MTMILVTEMFKTITDINPSYTKSMFFCKANAKVCPNDIEVRYYETTSYGDKSFVRSENMESPAIKHTIRNTLNKVRGIY